MSQENRFTFFPDPEEADYFHSASSEDLYSFFLQQPRMSARGMHELLSNGRVEELRASLTLLALFLPNIIPSFITDLIRSSALMRAEYHVSQEDVAAFVRQTTALIHEVDPQQEFMPEKILARIEELASQHPSSTK